MSLNEMDSIWLGAGDPAGIEKVENAALWRVPPDVVPYFFSLLFEGTVTAVTNFLEKYTFVWQQKSLQNWRLLRAYLGYLLGVHIFKLCLILLSDPSHSDFNFVLFALPKLSVPLFPYSSHLCLLSFSLPFLLCFIVVVIVFVCFL